LHVIASPNHTDTVKVNAAIIVLYRLMQCLEIDYDNLSQLLQEFEDYMTPTFPYFKLLQQRTKHRLYQYIDFEHQIGWNWCGIHNLIASLEVLKERDVFSIASQFARIHETLLGLVKSLGVQEDIDMTDVKLAKIEEIEDLAISDAELVVQSFLPASPQLSYSTGSFGQSGSSTASFGSSATSFSSSFQSNASSTAPPVPATTPPLTPSLPPPAVPTPAPAATPALGSRTVQAPVPQTVPAASGSGATTPNTAALPGIPATMAKLLAKTAAAAAAATASSAASNTPAPTAASAATPVVQASHSPSKSLQQQPSPPSQPTVTQQAALSPDPQASAASQQTLARVVVNGVSVVAIEACRSNADFIAAITDTFFMSGFEAASRPKRKRCLPTSPTETRPR
jgi:hypothetical protein